MRRFLILAIALITACSSLIFVQPSHAQTAPCGIVDSITYPFDGVIFDRDDFALYRAPFAGRHAGVDMAFDRYGDPVRAIARGRVTFSDPAGWDTEKGVVIIEHTLPDQSIVYSLYGHMEPIKGNLFPVLGQCVAPGEVVGGVGNPSRGAPHLHFEVRRREANAGGPGYSRGEPLDSGWLHPIDFIMAWQLRLKPGYLAMHTAAGVPVARPVMMGDSSAIIGTETHIERRNPADELVWRLDVPRLSGMIALPDGRMLGRTADDQIVIVGDGQISGFWKADRALETPPLRVGDSLLFVGADQRLLSYALTGQLIWQAGPFGDHLEKYAVSGDLIALSTGRAGNFNIYVLNSEGKILFQAAAAMPIIPTPAKTGGFYMLVGPQVGRLDAAGKWKPLLDVGSALGRQAQLAVDARGNAYVYPGFGQKFFAFTPDSKLRWVGRLPGLPSEPPLLDIGGGCLLYALTGDGVLNLYRTTDGALRGMTRLYPGGGRGNEAARWLRVSETDQVQFSAGYLTTATVDGLTLAGLKTCDA